MEKTMEEKIAEIAETYGYEPQSRQCIEEMAELTQAINKYWRKELDCGKKSVIDVPHGSPCEENLVEELADVQIMLWQMSHLLKCDIIPVIKQKIERQMERLEKRKKGEPHETQNA